MIYCIFSKLCVRKTGYSYEKVSCIGAYDNEEKANSICNELNNIHFEKIFYDAVSLRYKLLHGLSEIDYVYYNNLYETEYFVTIGGYEFQDIAEIEHERKVILSKKWLDETIAMYSHDIETYFIIKMDLNNYDLSISIPLN